MNSESVAEKEQPPVVEAVVHPPLNSAVRQIKKKSTRPYKVKCKYSTFPIGQWKTHKPSPAAERGATNG